MIARPSLPSAISDPGVIAIARSLNAKLEPVADALFDGGIRAFEVALDDRGATLHTVERLAGHAVGTPLLIGAGTVLTTIAAAAALDAGDRFLVMPHTDPSIIEWAAKRGVPVVPGALTPSEALAGWQAGAAAITVFPASAVGVGRRRGPSAGRGPWRSAVGRERHGRRGETSAGAGPPVTP